MAKKQAPSASASVGTIGRRQPGQGQMIAALIMSAFRLEAAAPLAVDQPGGDIREAAVGVAKRRAPLGFEEQRPSAAEPPEHVVGARRRGDQLGLGGALEVGSAEREGPLEAAVLVEDDAIGDQRRPRQMVGQPVGGVAIFSQAQHGR